MASTHKFEYVVTTSKDDIFVLTEKEKNYVLDHQDLRFIDLPVGVINPAYIVSIKKEKIDVLKDRFPCKACFRSGVMKVDNNFTPCTTCGGTGADIKE